MSESIIISVDNVEWWKAPLPRRWHRCTPQSFGVAGGNWVDRCASGAIRLDGYGTWMRKNSRRKT